MRPFGALLPFEEAKAILDAHITPVTRTETVALDDAFGRVLADDMTALVDVPPFDRASMDGYAVRSQDVSGASKSTPRILRIAGEAHAGAETIGSIAAGSCLQISTGSMMPAGADAVVMVEDTELDSSDVKVFKAVGPGANVGRHAEDIAAGSLVLKAGTYLDAGKVGVVASQGLTRVKVYARPSIAVLPTGEEVVPQGKKLRPGQLYDINSHTIASVVKDNGGIPVKIGIAGDSIESLKKTISEALRNDMAVLSGGSSVGTRDLLVDVIEGWGQVLFHGLRVKPGKPTIFAMIEGKPLMGMPGYPTSCLVNAYLFLAPALRKMARLPPRKGSTVETKLSRTIRGADRRQFYTVKVVDGQAVPVYKESGAITSIAAADGYITIPENIEELQKGTQVTVTLF
jgi:molybdenum cofactor synthesis domain-containing protein